MVFFFLLQYRYKEGGVGGRGESLVTNSAYTHQIAEIQHKQRKTKRHASVSSDNFSSSRTDSWRHGGGRCIPGERELSFTDQILPYFMQCLWDRNSCINILACR